MQSGFSSIMKWYTILSLLIMKMWLNQYDRVL